MEEKSCVCSVSGGLDSTTLLYYSIEQGYTPYVLTLNYKQRHKKEISYAKKVVSSISRSIIHEVVDISSINKLLLGSALTDDVEVPHGHYADESMKATVVPNRNMIMLSIAAGWAVAVGVDVLFYGAHKGDVSVYPDCRKEFVTPLGKAIQKGNYHQVTLKAPFLNKTKADVVKLGDSLGVPFEKTWSCYQGEKRPCLQCGTCVERTEAFMLNNLKDPLLSKKEWERALTYVTRG